MALYLLSPLALDPFQSSKSLVSPILSQTPNFTFRLKKLIQGELIVLYLLNFLTISPF
jgi:hypothetical protein